MMKIAAICETHFVGIIPHFTGPIATAALVNSLGTFSGPASDGIRLRGANNSRTSPSASISRTASSIQTTALASVWELDMSKLTQILEVTKYDTNRAQTYFRPDGSITHW